MVNVPIKYGELNWTSSVYQVLDTPVRDPALSLDCAMIMCQMEAKLLLDMLRDFQLVQWWEPRFIDSLETACTPNSLQASHKLGLHQLLLTWTRPFSSGCWTMCGANGAAHMVLSASEQIINRHNKYAWLSFRGISSWWYYRAVWSNVTMIADHLNRWETLHGFRSRYRFRIQSNTNAHKPDTAT
jgi:hypothetical protein